MSRILPRYTDPAIEHDPLETMLAQAETATHQAREAINNGTYQTRTALNPRGWPIQTKGVGGTQPGTSPHTLAATGWMDEHRLRH